MLHTMPAKYRSAVETKLRAKGIAYAIFELSNGNMNVFFGADECIEVIREINKPRLNDYTDEEDFILGTMLGYARLPQCQRYITRKRAKQTGKIPARICGCKTRSA